MKEASKMKTVVDVEEQESWQQTLPSKRKMCPTSIKEKASVNADGKRNNKQKIVTNVMRAIIMCVKWCSWITYNGCKHCFNFLWIMY